MNKKISIGVAVSLILIAVSITFTATVIYAMRSFDSKVSSAQERASMFDKLSEIDKVVRANMLYPVEDTQLSDNLSEGYMAGLGDEGAKYLTADEIIARNNANKGTVVTTGLEVASDASGYLLVTDILPDSSAAAEGMQIGDIIISVDGTDLLPLDPEDASALLPGAEGSESAIVYTRDGEESEVILTRTTLMRPSVESDLKNGLYYINIAALSDTTASQFETAIKEAVANSSVHGIIIDIRGLDGGTSLEPIANMLDILLPTGTLLSGTFSGGVNKVLYTSNESSVEMPVAVLVEGETRGYSEAFAAVMGDTEGCVIVGTVTAGEGTLRQLYPLNDGSGVEFTVAVINAPVSGAYDGVGVVPDYEVEVGEDFVRTSSPSELTDPQFARAVDALSAALWGLE